MCFIFYFKTACKRYTATSLKQATPHFRCVTACFNTWLGQLPRRASSTRIFFYKQLGSGLSPQSCLHFQAAWGSKLLNGCLVIWSRNLCLQEYSSFGDSKPISDFDFLPMSIFWDNWILMHCRFNSYFTLITKEKLLFSLFCSFYCCLQKEFEPWKVLSNLPSGADTTFQRG